MPFALVVFLIVGLVIWMTTQQQREVLNRGWTAVAERFALTLRPASWNVAPSLDGSIGRFPLTVDIDRKRTGKHNTPHTRFRLGMRPLGLGLELREKNFLSSISRAFGGRDIETGDSRFDERFVVKGRDAAAVRAFLGPERREVIERFFSAYRGAVITDDQIAWSKRGRVSRESDVLAAIDALVTVGQALADEDSTAADVLPAAMASTLLAAPGDPDLADASDVVDVADATHAANAPVPLPPTEPSAADAATGASAGPPAVPAAAATATVPVAEFCAAVFAPGALSFEASRVFKERYERQPASWSGTLESAEPYNYDFVFGPGRGVRATLAVHRVDGSAIGDGTVRAVVQLPAGTDGLDGRIGERIAFAGRLIKVDGLMRKVFAADARLLEDPAGNA